LQVDGSDLLLFPNCVQSLRRAVPDGLVCELVVTDWDSNDWPLIDWLKETAAPISTTIVSAEGSFSRGKGLNMAAQAAKGDILFFFDADALLCASLIHRVQEVGRRRR
jgi:hypothetical protein